MTTKRNDKLNTKTDVTSVNPPSLYNIQYPNSRTGMFSLRAPFKDFNTNFKDFNTNQSQQQIYTRNITPNVVQPKYLHMDQDQQERYYNYQPIQRDAQVQCSLNTPDSRERVVVRGQQTVVADPHNYGYLSPRYRVQLNLQPAQPNIYEVWDVETPPPRSIPINEPIRRREPSIRVRSPRLVSIKSLSDDDDESDYDDHLLYARYPPISYLPSHVRMVRVRQDANTICY